MYVLARRYRTPNSCGHHALRQIPGIGEWTAQYVAMRARSWPDAFPHTDLGPRKALGETNFKKILLLAEKWRPWRAYAAHHLLGQPGEKIMNSYSILKTSALGDLLLVANSTHLIGVYFLDCEHAPVLQNNWVLDLRQAVLAQAREQLQEYLDGSRTNFWLPLYSVGSDFQKCVWREIAKVSFGQIITYSELAARAGNPSAIRAAGTATGRNPLGREKGTRCSGFKRTWVTRATGFERGAYIANWQHIESGAVKMVCTAVARDPAAHRVG